MADEKIKQVTQLDTLTIKNLEDAERALQRKIDDENVSESTKKKAQQMQNKYRAQRAKTIRLYEKNIKKGKLVGINKSILSVKKILELDGKNTNVKDTAMKEWLNYDNIAKTLGITLSVAGALSIGNGAGFKLAWKGITAACKAMFTTGAWNAVGSAMLLGGGAALASVIAKKAITKNLNANALLRDEAEKEIEENTYKSHDFVKKAKNEVALIAEASTNEEVFRHLMSIASNPTNSPEVINQANRILAGARVQMAENQAKARQAILSEALQAGNDLRELDQPNNPKVTYIDSNGKKQTISIHEAYERGIKLQEIEDLRNKKDKTVKYNINSNANNNTKDFIKIAVDTANDNNYEEQKQLIEECKDENDFVSRFNIDENDKDKDLKKQALRAAYNKMKANIEYETRLTADEFKEVLDAKTNQVDGIEIDGKSQTVIKSQQDYALVQACVLAGLVDGTNITDVSALATQLKAKYGSNIEAINQNIKNIMNAERTGMVK